MEEKTSNVVEFISEASSQFCDTYYKEGCASCPLNLAYGDCLLTDIAQIITPGINDYLKQRGGESGDERRISDSLSEE